jgi:flagellar motor switch protein FliN/FliY
MSSSPNSSSSSDLPDLLAPLHDVACHVDVVLGTASMTVRQCLALKRDSILRLSQSAGNDLQVVVNGVGIALGEVVIIDSSTAVRVTDILAPPSNEAFL